MSTTNRTSATSEPSVRLTVLVPSSSNAYVALLSEALKKHGAATRKMTLSRLLFAHYDVLHLHWPEKLIRGRGLLGVLRLVAYPAIARIRRKQVIWTCHNLTPHEGLTSSWQRIAWDLFRRLVSGTVHLSFATREIAFECMPELARLPSVVAPHGDYRWYYGTLADPASSRAALGIPPEAYVLGWFGRIRSYKGLEELLAAFVDTRRAEARLLVAGAPDDERIAAKVRLESGKDCRIVARLDYIDDLSVPALLASMDCGILPFRAVHNSGSAILMLSYGVPIFAPDAPAFRSLREIAGAEWVHLFEPPLSDMHVMHVLSSAPRGKGELPDLSALDWNEAAAECIRLYGHFSVKVETAYSSRPGH